MDRLGRLDTQVLGTGPLVISILFGQQLPHAITAGDVPLLV